MTSRLALLGIPLAAAALWGCAGVTDRSYGLDDGDANYDALKAATEKCRTDGGTLRLRPGSDSQRLSNFECAIGKAR